MKKIKYIISDLDGTLTKVDVLDFIASQIGKGEESAILRAKYKEEGISTLKNRINLLNLLNIKQIELILRQNIDILLRDNFIEFRDYITTNNIKLIIVSGNISPVVDFFKKVLSAKIGFGTEINISRFGQICGMKNNYTGKELNFLLNFLSENNIDINEVVYMGDDISDIPFFKIFTKHISFNASLPNSISPTNCSFKEIIAEINRQYY